MGYKGGGLGKNEQGIVTPIEAKIRPKNMGMGFNETRMDEDEKNYDMQGPHQFLENLEDADEKLAMPPMPELQHNLRLILDLTRLDIQNIDEDLRIEKETAISLQKHKDVLENMAAQQKLQLDNMDKILLLLSGQVDYSLSLDQQLMCAPYILPILQVALQELQINQKKINDHFSWVMSWASMLPNYLMVDLMDRFFFPKWLHVLYQWLTTNPNFEEIHNWYVGWKGLIPQQLLADENIRAHLNIALNMMSQAADGLRVVEQRAPHKAEATVLLQAADDQMTLKEIIQAYAQQNDLLFMPKPGRMHNGHQIYAFHNKTIYVDSLNQMLYAKKEQGWVPVTLDTLLNMQH
ncbi:hypothetical protein EZV62_002242 [Acer yangbiense]|uniref:G-patch domain-containing protein n=1 Tax=Acer yangbiense TaxID=1000413 RepID=A0A5C7IWQ8_9ROSI|nr:hypothetical protein EZV62_002242 [Acer yangbiense]